MKYITLFGIIQFLWTSCHYYYETEILVFVVIFAFQLLSKIQKNTTVLSIIFTVSTGDQNYIFRLFFLHMEKQKWCSQKLPVSQYQIYYWKIVCIIIISIIIQQTDIDFRYQWEGWEVRDERGERWGVRGVRGVRGEEWEGPEVRDFYLYWRRIGCEDVGLRLRPSLWRDYRLYQLHLTALSFCNGSSSSVPTVALVRFA